MLGILFLSLSPAHAKDATVQAAIAVDGNTTPATVFTPNTPKLYAFFHTKGTKSGDHLRAKWIAVDTGGLAPPNYDIDELGFIANRDDFSGAFSLSKPNNGWPIGKYRVDIYLNGNLATTVQFAIR